MKRLAALAATLALLGCDGGGDEQKERLDEIVDDRQATTAFYARMTDCAELRSLTEYSHKSSSTRWTTPPKS